ncbi:helix-turn-helix transcriptional regulator [Streptomyces nigra]|uniref:helix-turn-helix transcriptional regulator n=1 Tax=Streptomyces nigra TaxID=1827580 RepID=UPI0037D95571
MTVTEIATEHGVSRQTIHTYRRTGIFPAAVSGEGSTRLRFREDEVVAFFKANPKQPRKKRRPQQQGVGVHTHFAHLTVTVTNLDGADGETDDVVRVIDEALASAGYEGSASVTDYSAYPGKADSDG